MRTRIPAERSRPLDSTRFAGRRLRNRNDPGHAPGSIEETNRRNSDDRIDTFHDEFTERKTSVSIAQDLRDIGDDVFNIGLG